MKIPIRYNPLGNDHDVQGGAMYGSKGCFLFRGSYCIQSAMRMDGSTINGQSGQPSRLELYASGSTSKTTVMGGTMYVDGGNATDTEVFAGATMHVRGEGVASGVRIPAGCDVVASAGGAIYNPDLYQLAATITANSGGSLMNVVVGEQCNVYCNSALVDGAVLVHPSSTLFVNNGTARNVTLNNSVANIVATSGYLNNITAFAGLVSFPNDGSADNFTVSGNGTLNIYRSFIGRNINIDGGRLMVIDQGSGLVDIQGTCAYGLYSVGSGSVSGGVYANLNCANGLKLTDIHMNSNAIISASNNVKATGIDFTYGGSLTANVYTTCGAVTLSKGVVRAGINARSTISNVRFLNGVWETVNLSAFGDGAFMDITAGSGATVVITGGNASLIRDVALSSGNINVLQFGSVYNLYLSRGMVSLAPYVTASGVTVEYGTITIAGATATDVTLTSSGALVYQNGSMSNFGVLAGGYLCGVRFGSNQKAINGTLSGWGRAYLSAGAMLTSVHLAGVPLTFGGACKMRDCTIDAGGASGSVMISGAGGSIDGLTVNGYTLTCTGIPIRNYTHNATDTYANYTLLQGENWTLNESNAHLAGVTCTTIAYVGGTYTGSACALDGVNVSSGAIVKLNGGAHSRITIASGATLELSNGTATTVHVMEGGSLACVSNGYIYACTSDAGAIVTGSNIQYVE